jgi:excisionase family DNA binding protein
VDRSSQASTSLPQRARPRGDHAKDPRAARAPGQERSKARCGTISGHQRAARPRSATAAEVMTATQLSEYLQLPERTVYEYAARGLLPSKRIGRHVRFLRWQIDAALNED